MANPQQQQEQERRAAEEAAAREEKERKAAAQPGGPTTATAAPHAGTTAGTADPKAADTRPAERRVGVYMKGATLARDGKHYGGTVVDNQGRILAMFDEKQENTGDPDAGTKPK